MSKTGTIDCLFCSGYFMASDDEPEPHVGHSLPACEPFLTLDALDFIIAARRAKGIPAPSEDVN